jgi:ATP-dependent RNA helicase DeaD
MLDMGFIEDIESILAMTPATRQTVLFSATLPGRIDSLARRYLRDPERISVAPDKQGPKETPRVRQTAYVVSRATKAAALQRVLDAEDPTAAIVFCRTRGGVDELTDVLTSRGYQAEALHGGLTQDQRDRVMSRLRSGTTDLLVATDVAARGLDIDQLTHVVNYDLPVSPEAYVHRIGRVGRAGREGVAVSLVEPRERRLLSGIEKMLGGPIPTGPLPSVADVRNLRTQRTRTAIEDLLADDDAKVRMEGYRDVVEEMLQDHDALEIVLASFAAAHEATQGTADDVEIEIVEERKAATGKSPRGKATKDGKPKKDGKEKKSRRLDVPTQRLFVSVGRKEGVTPGDLVGAVTGETSLKGKDIGIVTVHEAYALIEVPADKARKAARDLQHCTIKGRRVKVRLDRA